MSIADLPIQIDREKIEAFCRARGIRKLSLFGSVLREDFDPQRSDVEVLAEFEPGALQGVGLRYFGYGEELALDRPECRPRARRPHRPFCLHALRIEGQHPGRRGQPAAF